MGDIFLTMREKNPSLVARLILWIVLAGLLFTLSVACNRKEPQYGISREDLPQTVTSREESLDLLRNIGMNVFDDNAVEAPDFTARDTGR